MNENVINKTGFLTKRSISSLHAFANWKERFFVLADMTLTYYKQGSTGFFNNTKDELVHLKGEIEVTRDTVVRECQIDDRVNCFEVVTPQKRLYAQASNGNDMKEWIQAIQSHINVLNHKKNPKQSSNRKVKAKSFHQESSESSGSSRGCGSELESGNQGRSSESQYLRPSLIESNDLVKSVAQNADVSTDPKDVVIKQLVEENRWLRHVLAQKEQELHALNNQVSGFNSLSEAGQQRSNSSNLGANSGSRSGQGKAPQPVLDLRDVRKKQILLWDAAEKGDFNSLNRLVSDPFVDVNAKGLEQWSALHFACQYNHLNIIKLLLGRGAQVNSRTCDRLTPLHISSRGGFPTSVEILLSAGADPNLTEGNGNGAIHLAAECGHIQVVKLLISNGAKTDVANATGSLPVHLAPIGHPIRVLLNSNSASSKDLLLKKEGSNLNSAGDPKDSKLQKQDSMSGTNYGVAFKNKYSKDLALGPRDFEFVKVLGRGAFAKVYLVRGKGSNKDKWFALKAYNKHAIVQKNQAQYIHTEKAALQACSDHPFIVSLHFAFQSDDRLFLVMDYCGGGDLLSALTRKKTFSESEAAFYIGEIVLALSHLHSKNIVFRDLKPENVVLDLEGNALLTDFGISKEGIQDHTSASTFCGSPMYLAPEMITRSGHGFALDWYSVGALLYELLTGLPPFYTNDKKQLFHNILRGQLPIPDYISQNAASLIRALLHKDPKQRLGSGPKGDQEIMDHPFFTSNLDWDKLYNKKIPPPFRPNNPGNSKSGIPDISNFPQAFTEQAISDFEKGVQSGGNLQHKNPNLNRQSGAAQKLANQRAALVSEGEKLFQDFDFAPEPSLNEEAKAFEKMAVGKIESKKNIPPAPTSNPKPQKPAEEAEPLEYNI